jgi:non-specific serine/threonine protein kinase
VAEAKTAMAQKPDCEGVYYLLGRALFAAGRYQEIADIADRAVELSGTDYNVYVPVINALNALGKTDAARNMNIRRVQALENQLREVPDDARARVQLAIRYAALGREDDAMREAQMAIALRPNEAMVLYNAACAYCMLQRKPEALDALKKAWDVGFKDANWARRDPDLAILHDEPEFQRLYPE